MLVVVACQHGQHGAVDLIVADKIIYTGYFQIVEENDKTNNTEIFKVLN